MVLRNVINFCWDFKPKSACLLNPFAKYLIAVYLIYSTQETSEDIHEYKIFMNLVDKHESTFAAIQS